MQSTGNNGPSVVKLQEPEQRSTEREAVMHPDHYGGDTPYEVIKVLYAWDPEKAKGFCWGNAIKYMARTGRKDPSKKIEDLQKARTYLDFLIDFEQRDARGV